MARIRSIFPGFFTDDAVMQASLAARWLLIGIWSECDDQGAFQWRPATLKARIMPNDNVDVPALLDELVSLKFLMSYEHGEVKFGLVRNFCKFQRPKKPNSIHFIPEQFRTFTGSTKESSEPEAVKAGASSEPDTTSTPASSEPVPNQFPTGSEPVRKSPNRGRREDGGGMMEEESSSRAREPEKPTPIDRLAQVMNIDVGRLMRRTAFQGFPGFLHDWKVAGCDPERDIWPTIERVSKRKSDISSPKFFETAILEARDNRIASEPSELERWTTRVEGFFKDGFWHPGWGPNPDEPGCLAPPELVNQPRKAKRK